MKYVHHIVISRSATGSGSQDADTGAFTAGGDAVSVYEGPADVQSRIRTVRREADGDPVIVSEADVYLKTERTILSIREGDYITITFPTGVVMDGRIVSLNELSGFVSVNQLTPWS